MLILPNVWNIRPGGALARVPGSCMGYRGGAIGYPRSGGKGRARILLPLPPSPGLGRSALLSPSRRCRRAGDPVPQWMGARVR